MNRMRQKQRKIQKEMKYLFPCSHLNKSRQRQIEIPTEKERLKGDKDDEIGTDI